MSLVHQALRKAEAEKQRHAPPPAAPSGVTAPVVAPVAALDKRGPPAPPAPSPRPVEPSSARLLPVALIALAAVAIVALVVIATRPAPGPGPVVREQNATAEPPRLPRAATELPPPPVAERWKLTGISKDPAGNYLAIINGSLRGVNEYVDGAVVKSIERDRVTLEVEGREQVVRLF